GGEGAADGGVGAEVEPGGERVRVRGWLGGEQPGCRKVVEKHRCDGAASRRRPRTARVEHVRRPPPEPGDGAKADRERKKKRQGARLEAGPQTANGGGGEPDREYGQGRAWQRHYERRSGERGRR